MRERLVPGPFISLPARTARVKGPGYEAKLKRNSLTNLTRPSTGWRGRGLACEIRAGHCQRKRWKKTTGAAKKPCTQSIMQKYLQQRETVGEAAADEEEEQEEEQEDTEDSGGESGDDKCMVCGEKEEDDVDIEDWVACEMCSQWIHSKCIPSNHPYSISHADFHCHI